LPIFPDRVTHIPAEIAFHRHAGKVYCFSGHLPVFVHEDDSCITLRSISSETSVAVSKAIVGVADKGTVA
jgi:hypothetical protein